jgi:GNAT superfamily N-acetyltransferase
MRPGMGEEIILGIGPNNFLDMNLPITMEDIVIRTDLRPGDIGYVTYLHGDLYKKEYGYGIAFEAYVAKGFYEFYSQYDPARDRVWVAEHGDRIIGFLLLMHRKGDVAQLRYFILASPYRGIGLGKKLAALFLAFAREQGYRRCYLWTTDELFAAAHIYRKMGFVLAEEVESTSFGKGLKEQRYELILMEDGSNADRAPGVPL